MCRAENGELESIMMKVHEQQKRQGKKGNSRGMIPNLNLGKQGERKEVGIFPPIHCIFFGFFPPLPFWTREPKQLTAQYVLLCIVCATIQYKNHVGRQPDDSSSSTVRSSIVQYKPPPPA